MSTKNPEAQARLIEAAKKGRRKECLRAIKDGANLHLNEEEALREACYNGWPKTTKALLKAGANPHIQNDSPLALSVTGAHLEVMKILLQVGCKPCRLMLQRANQFSRRDILETLLPKTDKTVLAECICNQEPFSHAVKTEILRRENKSTPKIDPLQRTLSLD